MRVPLGALLVVGILSSCHRHVHHRPLPPPPPPFVFHHHRLDCGHEVSCRYRGSVHEYQPHRAHDSYWHLHRARNGKLYRCYVERSRHRR